MPETGDYYDRFSGKDLDEELDKEGQSTDTEEIAADLTQAYSDIKDSLPMEFKETIEDIIDTVGIYYDDDEEWHEVSDGLTDLFAQMEMADSDEFLEREDEFAEKLESIHKLTERLIPKNSVKKAA